jgi:hypothetical protein
VVNKTLVLKIAVIFLVLLGSFPLFYFVSVEVGIAEASEETLEAGEGVSTFDRYVENVAFGVNEKLTFDINYGFINAGTATMEVARLIEYENRPCYQVITRAKSNSFFSTFYKVDDRVESIIDAIGIFSWRFEKNLREGRYRADRVYTFDQRRRVVYYKNDTISTPPFVQDALSVLYYVRTQKLKPGMSLFIDNFTDGKLYPLEVKVLKRERVKVKAGVFDCLVVEPLLKSVGVFRHQGRLRVWLTDDRLKMPVMMKSKVVVGSITAELTDYQLGDIEVF